MRQTNPQKLDKSAAENCGPIHKFKASRSYAKPTLYNDSSPHKLSLAACPVLLMTFLYNDNLQTRSDMFYRCLAVSADIEQSAATTTSKIKEKILIEI